jgi:tetratricopeptide (TPR) repeat protein
MEPGKEHRRSGRGVAVLVAILAAAAVLVLWLALREGPEGEGARDGPPLPEEQLAREMAAAYFAQDRKEQTLEALRPLIERPDARADDLVDAAAVHLTLANVEEVRELLERAARSAPDSPRVAYATAQLALMEGEYDRALAQLRRAHELAPEDLPATLALAERLEDEEPAEAERLYREVVAQGVEDAGSWYMVALYRLAMMLLRQDRMEEANALLDEHRRLEQRGLRPPQDKDILVGNLASVRPPAPQGNRPAGPGALPRLGATERILAELAGASGMQLADLDDDGDIDVIAWGATGLFAGVQGEGFRWSAQRLVEGPVDRALAFDLGNDDDLDLVYAQGGVLRILEGDRAEAKGPVSWRPWAHALPELGSAPAEIAAVDADHDGDLDLVLVGAFGARLLRDDGSSAPFVDVSAEAGLPGDRAFAWVRIEDFDTDRDVDLYFGGGGPAYLASNVRGGRFEDRSDVLREVGTLARAPLIADLDGDARPDIWTAGRLWTGGPSGAFRLAREGGAGAGAAANEVHASDIDLDGSLDVYWLAPSVTGAHALRGVLSVGFPFERELELPLELDSPPLTALLADLDGGEGLAHDLVVLTAEGLAVRRGAQPGTHAVRLGYRGRKDNRRGVGAVVEMRAGPIYRRLFWHGEPELAGTGGGTELDYVRITWPNGVVQYDLRRTLGDRAATGAAENIQVEGLIASCPFLYAWNGERNVFVSDVLGITPLGLPTAKGRFVPPDHDEYVLVLAEELRPREGVLELHLTEELRETTYLDRARLDAIDHPADARIYPNERFTFPPFPEPHVHTVRTWIPPLRAIGSDGRDWTAVLARADGDYAAPFEPAPPQFLGLAEPHWLELEFDRDALARAARMRLVMTGWFMWTDASVNMAASVDPDQEFVPPTLQLEDEAGAWRDAGPPIGFPAGKPKTMVVDVTELLPRGKPRLRIRGTLRLYWDSIVLATDGDDAPLEVRSLEPVSARLWRRGFSEPEPSPRAHQPERFTWERLARFPRWNPMPGLYTPYGECEGLLHEIDDRFVVLGAGDALTLHFDASELPPVREGWRRDYLLFLDGWAKDNDPNTVHGETVEPLPFHGMSAYPYGSEERFPDGPEHRSFRREWLTRTAEAWIPLVAPPAAEVVGREGERED